MKRLKKKAWGKVELYHATSSQVLMKVTDSGYLEPAGYTGVTSNGLNEDDETTKERKPSGDQNGVYLGNEPVLSWYRERAVAATNFNTDLPNIPTDLKVNVETDSLSPDYDDIQINLPEDERYDNIKDLKENMFNSDEPLWKQSLDEIDQVVHNGPISADEIQSARFQMSGIVPGDKLKGQDPIAFLEQYIKFNAWMSFEEAIQQLNEMKQAILAIDNKQQVAKSRLKKITRGN